MLGSLAEGLALLWTVDAAEADTVGMVTVQDFDDVAVEDAYDMAGEVGGVSRGRP